MRMRAEGKGPTHARRGWSEGPEWGVWSAERSAEDKKKRAAKSDERELDSARRLIILRRVDVCREWRAYFGLKILYIYI